MAEETKYPKIIYLDDEKTKYAVVNSKEEEDNVTKDYAKKDDGKKKDPAWPPNKSG